MHLLINDHRSTCQDNCETISQLPTEPINNPILTIRFTKVLYRMNRGQLGVAQCSSLHMFSVPCATQTPVCGLQPQRQGFKKMAPVFLFSILLPGTYFGLTKHALYCLMKNMLKFGKVRLRATVGRKANESQSVFP